MPVAYKDRKFTQENIKKIFKRIANGTPYQIAAEANGVHRSTFYDWISNGLRDQKAGIISDYTIMVESLRNMQSERIEENLGKIRKGKYGHKGCEWELSRSFWQYFSDRTADLEFDERLEKLESNKSQNASNEIDVAKRVNDLEQKE